MNYQQKIFIDQEREAKENKGQFNIDELFRYKDQCEDMTVYNFTDKTKTELMTLGEHVVDKMLIDFKVKFHEEEYNGHIFEAPFFELEADPDEFVLIFTEDQLNMFEELKYLFLDLVEHLSLECKYKDEKSGYEILFKFTPYDHFCIAGDVYRISYKTDFILGEKD